MSKLLFLSVAVAAMCGCAGKKGNEKVVLNEVIEIHDKVMNSEERLMRNKTLLDSMVKFNSTGNIKDSVYNYLARINLTDSLMGDWMHKFDPEQANRSDDQKFVYFTDEKKKITSINSQMNAVIKQSDTYLIKLKKK